MVISRTRGAAPRTGRLAHRCCHCRRRLHRHGHGALCAPTFPHLASGGVLGAAGGGGGQWPDWRRPCSKPGGEIFEHAPVTGLDMAWRAGVRLEVEGKAVSAKRVVFATSAFCLPLLGLQDWAGGVHTIALATEPLPDAVFDAIGWATRTPFYTLDQPYLWGRATADGRAVIGGGTTGRGAVEQARVDAPAAVQLFANLERRIPN